MLSALQNPRQAAAQIMNFALILSSAFMVRPHAPVSLMAYALIQLIVAHAN